MESHERTVPKTFIETKVEDTEDSLAQILDLKVRKRIWHRWFPVSVVGSDSNEGRISK
jgi:hypothetical protein